MIIDSHCHIDFEIFDPDRDQVLQRALNLRIEHIIVPAVSADTWDRVKQTCHRHTQLHPAYGLHPYFIDLHEHTHLDMLDQWLTKERPIAVGECGLDFFLKELDRDKQLEFFEAQLSMALEHQLPVVIHSRKATEQVIQSIKKYPGLRGMIHSYSGSFEQALQLIELGFFISFGGAITFDKATRVRAIAQNIPLQALLVETDAPDQPGSHHYGNRNEPGFIIEVLDVLAELRGVDLGVVVEATSCNAVELFGL